MEQHLQVLCSCAGNHLKAPPNIHSSPPKKLENEKVKFLTECKEQDKASFSGGKLPENTINIVLN